jgi:hypothetical protein
MVVSARRLSHRQDGATTFGSRVVACVLVFLTFVGTAGAWHAGDDDADFAAVTLHDHAAHHERLSATRVSSPLSHCAICHWLQGFRIDTIPGSGVSGDDAAQGPVVACARHPRQFLVRVDVPSRAPPAQFS